MKITRPLLLAALLACLPSLSAEDPFSEFPNALGMFGNTLSGNPGGGLHYQRWGDVWGFQITAGGGYDPEETWGRILDYSVNAEAQRALYTNQYSSAFAGRLYLWASAGHQGFIASESSDETRERGELSLDAAFGLGIGIEAVLLEHFSFPFEFGYTGTFPDNPRVTFSVAGGIRYRF